MFSVPYTRFSLCSASNDIVPVGFSASENHAPVLICFTLEERCRLYTGGSMAEAYEVLV